MHTFESAWNQTSERIEKEYRVVMQLYKPFTRKLCEVK